MRWFATLRNMFKVNNKQLLDQFNNDETFRVNVSYHLASIGKSGVPYLPRSTQSNKGNNLFMICPFIPFIGLIICFISPSTGVLITLFSILLNIVLSGTLKRTYDRDLKVIILYRESP